MILRTAALALIAALSAAPAAAEDALDSFSQAPLDASETCLATAIYYEAGFEPLAGREAVAQVILNRLADARYPKTVCGVVYQGSKRQTGCQFTFTCDGSLARAPDPRAYAEAAEIARRLLSGAEAAEPTLSANHYHADYVRPAWARSMAEVARIGRHIFYSDGGAAKSGRAPRTAPAAPAPGGFQPWGLSVSALGATPG